MSSFSYAIEYLEFANSGGGILFNSLLLFAIIRYSGPNFGAYKNLLTAFTLSDLCLVVLHVIVRPRTLLIGSTQGVVTDTVLDDRRVTAFYIAFQAIPFNLIIIHFLYRYWAVRRPQLIALFSRKSFILILSSIVLGGPTSWYYLSLHSTTDKDEPDGWRCLIDEYNRKYGRRIENAWIVLDHWHNNKLEFKLLLTVLLTDSLMFTSIIFVSTLAILTFYHMKIMAKMSPKVQTLQRKLLGVLCIQAAVPLVFVHVPTLIMVNFPLLRVHDTGLLDFCTPMYTCYPVLDAVLPILLISEYRRGLLGVMRKMPVVQVTSSQNSTFMTSHAPSIA